MMLGSTTEQFDRFLAEHAPIATQASFEVGECVGDWRITAFLGKGGNGEVYRAERVWRRRSRRRDGIEQERDVVDESNPHAGAQHAPPQAVALKIFVPDPNKSASQTNAARIRFEREARFLSENVYPFFPRFFGQGIVPPQTSPSPRPRTVEQFVPSCASPHRESLVGSPYFALELLAPAPLPSADAAVAAYVLQVAAAVKALHVQGIVHRDVKPQNVMRRANGERVLIDFGAVKEFERRPASTGATVTLVDGKAVGVGTPGYAAPEQFNGGAVSPATDVHALGMLVNACFGGKLPRAWERIVSRATSSIPECRFADVDAFTKAVRHRSRPRHLFVLAAVLSILVSLAFGLVRWHERHWPHHVDLNGQIRIIPNPIVLEARQEYEVVGPGTLDADVSGPTNATLRLKNCVLLNRTKRTFPENGIQYVLENGVYLNFINLPREPMGLRRRDYLAPYDGAYNEVRFGGPDTISGLMQLKNQEWYESLRDD